MNEELVEEIKQVLADVLGLSPRTLTVESSSDDIAKWDSVQHLNIMMALEERYGVEFEPEEIEEMRSVGAMARVLAARRG